MNIYLWVVLGVLALDYVLEAVSDWLNVRHISVEIPDEFKDCYDAERYARSQEYLRVNTRFDLFHNSIMLPLTVLFIVAGGFAWIQRLALSAGWGMIPTGLLFGGMLTLLGQIVELPFSLYETFVIEERFGFNRTTARTFVLDRVKGLALTALIGAPIFALVLWFFSAAGPWAWLYAWGALTIIQLFLMIIAPIVFLPLFNKFEPLEDGELKERLEEYARKQQFHLSGVFKMDGSRRSARSNAFFTGLGRWRRIALFDTLIEKHTVSELISILAHEVGHYKLGHIWKTWLMSAMTSALIFLLLDFFITQPGLYEAFGVAYEPFADGVLPIYAGMVFFAFLFSPIQRLLGVAANMVSRRHEYQADAFAVRTAGDPDSMASALKRLSVDNLSNLTPHPFTVFLHDSHPPVLDRIHAIRQGACHTDPTC